MQYLYMVFIHILKIKKVEKSRSEIIGKRHGRFKDERQGRRKDEIKGKSQGISQSRMVKVKERLTSASATTFTTATTSV